MRLVTLNVRNPSFDDGPNAWPHRRDAFFAVLRRLNPDVLCLQETIESHIAETLRETGFAGSFGLPREEESPGTEYCAVMTGLPVAAWDTEWLTDKPGELGWDARCPRVVTWVDFGSWVLFNTHLDHMGFDARTNGMAQIVRHSDRFGKPCLIAGDFNATPDEPALELARGAGFVDLAEGTGPTYDGFGGTKPWEGTARELWNDLVQARRLAEGQEDPGRREELFQRVDAVERRYLEYRTILRSDAKPPAEAVRIDYILARGPWTCERAWVERDYPPYSDHRAVVAELSL